MESFTLITGGASGIGYELAKLFAAQGNHLILVGRNQDKLDSAANLITAKHPTISVKTVRLDLGQPQSAKELYNHCSKQGFIVETLVNNAGIGLHGMHCDLNAEQLENMIHLNVLCLTALCHYFGHAMKSRGNGQILNIASLAAFQPIPFLSAYAASKSFVLNFSQALAMEMEDFGVKVSCLCPGSTATDFFDRAGIGETHQGLYATQSRMSSAVVAQHGIQLIQSRKLLKIPGFNNKILAFANRLLPRYWVAKITKYLTSR